MQKEYYVTGHHYVSRSGKWEGHEYTFKSFIPDIKIGDFVIVETKRGKDIIKVSGVSTSGKAEKYVLGFADELSVIDKEISRNLNEVKEKLAKVHLLSMEDIEAAKPFAEWLEGYVYLLDNIIDMLKAADSLCD